MAEIAEDAWIDPRIVSNEDIPRLRDMLAHRRDVSTPLSLGVESEGWCTTVSGAPVDLWNYNFPEDAGFTFEPGHGSIELVSVPVPSGVAAANSLLDALESLFSFCDAAHLVYSTPTPPFGRIGEGVYEPHVPTAIRPRYDALWKALRLEATERGSYAAHLGVNEMKYHAATQLNFGSIPEHVFLLVYNVLHYTGPFRRRAISGRYGLCDPGGLAMWGMQGTAMDPWAYPDRFTAVGCRWYADMSAYKTAFCRNPLLLLGGKGSVVCSPAPRNQRSYPVFGHQEHESNWWPDCRIRQTGKPMAEWVIEDRVYPAMSLQTLVRVSDDMLLLVARLIDLAGDRVYATPADAYELLMTLSCDRDIGYLIPEPASRRDPYPAESWLSDRIR